MQDFDVVLGRALNGEWPDGASLHWYWRNIYEDSRHLQTQHCCTVQQFTNKRSPSNKCIRARAHTKGTDYIFFPLKITSQIIKKLFTFVSFNKI